MSKRQALLALRKGRRIYYHCEECFLIIGAVREHLNLKFSEIFQILYTDADRENSVKTAHTVVTIVPMDDATGMNQVVSAMLDITESHVVTVRVQSCLYM